MRKKGTPYVPNDYRETEAMATARMLWRHLAKLLQQHADKRQIREIVTVHWTTVRYGSIRAYWNGCFLLQCPPSVLSRMAFSQIGLDHTPPPDGQTVGILWQAAVARAADHGKKLPRVFATHRYHNTQPSMIRLCRVAPVLWGSVPNAWAALEHERRHQTSPHAANA